MKKFLLSTILLFALLTKNSFSQSLLPNTWVTNGTVRTMLNDNDTVYVGGNFTRVSPSTGGGVIVSPTGNGDPIPGFPQVCGYVRVTVSDGAGGWYIGGNFTCVGGNLINSLAHINSDLTVDVGFNPGVTLGDVFCIALSNNTVYIGGTFTKVSNVSRVHLASIDKVTGVLTSWNPNPTPASATYPVYAIQISGNNVFVGGNFNAIGGITRKGIASIDTNTGTLHSWDPAGICPSLTGVYAVRSLLLSRDIIYAAGDFDTLGGCGLRYHLAALDTVTGIHTSWDPADLGVGTVGAAFYCLALSSDTLFVGGSFTKIGGQLRTSFAAVDTAGTGSVLNWTCNVTASTIVYSAAIQGNYVYPGGNFTSTSGTPMNYIARVDRFTGFTDLNWNPNPNLPPVYSIAISGNSLYIGGGLTGMRGYIRDRIFRFNANSGSVDPVWNPDVPANNVYAIAIKDSSVYIGGDFATVGGYARAKLAQISKSGSGAVNSNWNPGVSNGIVNTLAFSQTKDTLFVGGSFTLAGNVGGAARNGIAALSPYTNFALSWNPYCDKIVYSLISDGNFLYVGGSFDSIGSAPRKRLACLSTSIVTGNATAWNPGVGITAASYVDAMGIDSSHHYLYAGGSFNHMGGVASPNNLLSKVYLATGVVNSTFNPHPTALVSSLYVKGDDLIYAGGSFILVNGNITRNHVAVFTADSGLVLPWNPNANGGVNTIVEAAGSFFLGGAFTCLGANQTPSSYIAGIIGNCLTTFANAGSNVTVCLGDSVQLNATNGASYSWSPTTGLSNPNIANPWVHPIAVGTVNYVVTETSSGGCPDVASVSVTTPPPPASPDLNVTPNDSICMGSSVTISPSSPENGYLWSSGETTQNIVVSSAGTYSLYVTDIYGCGAHSIDSVTITVVPLPAAPVVDVISNGASLSTGAVATSYQWYYSLSSTGSGSSLGTAPTQASAATGYYWVCVWNSYGSDSCESCSAPLYISHTVGINEKASLQDNMDVFPNPFSETTSVSLVINQSTEVTLEVFDMIGNRIAVLENESKKSAGNYSYPLALQESGIYLVKLKTSEGEKVKRIVKN